MHKKKSQHNLCPLTRLLVNHHKVIFEVLQGLTMKDIHVMQ